jgi:hypothetical protein
MPGANPFPPPSGSVCTHRLCGGGGQFAIRVQELFGLAASSIAARVPARDRTYIARAPPVQVTRSARVLAR